MNPSWEIFDQLAERYDRWYEEPFGASAYALELDVLKKLVKNFHRGLEIGVGTGRFAAPLGISCGIDPSYSMLKIALKRGITAVQARGEDLPFSTHTFDLVLLMVTLCFVDRPEDVLREVARVLRPGGRLVLGLILKESPWARFYEEKGRNGHPIYRRARFYSFVELSKMLSETGFVIGKILSTLFEPPQTERPVSNQEVKTGFYPGAGFFVLSARKG
ncbi:class I SAM-dependent methyltransferase [Thermosulfurimonas sp. F29]|uniref:class I SAM-dependent methyltransferase n=1 Tax=Thermosulfurimonas sp. F29 TaxID=2867247 RepID=UPI001C82904C|nr:class I SAM-dependent methyltransferase [Thermosulfurimonas sp. F29]MBX6423886.1 methyltransferase domain-containing protein [Thermosulfurimonas sp. F29]